MPKYVVQHEFDDDPTYIVPTDDKENEVVTFSTSLPWKLRVKMAQKVCKTLNEED